jgi:apolipoprotein N-acyltransferase
MGDHFRKLHAQALAQVPRPDLVIYPETSYPQFWTELADGADLGDLHPRHREEIARIPAYFRHKAGSWGTATLLGLDCYVMTTATNERRYNSALLLTATGTVAGRYDKIHRVPFGEYVPFRDWFPWLQQLTPYEGDYGIAVGERWTRFPLCVQGAEYTFGAVICYEDTNPLLARQYVTGARPVDWLVNISNEGWFDGSSEHAAHLAICRFRAIECRRAVVRAVNLGISAVIDSNGAIVALPGPTWTDSVKVATIVSANVPLDTRSSPYAHLGDWLPIGAWIALLVMVGRQWRWGGGKRG